MPRLKPIDRWGFQETIDGKLAASFEIKVIEEAARFAGEILGWKAKAIGGKYAGSYIEMTPRHVDWSGVVVVTVFDNEMDRNVWFSGMANARDLECNWK